MIDIGDKITRERHMSLSCCIPNKKIIIQGMFLKFRYVN